MPFPAFVAVTMLVAALTLAAVRLLSRRTAVAVVAALAGATALLLLIGPAYLNCFADDAYITFRYSEHLGSGLGPNWNSADRVEGYTSFSWMGILAGLAKLDVDIVRASEVLGFLALLTTFGAMFAIWRLWAREEAPGAVRSPVLPAAAVVSLALTDGTTFWGFSGMETPLFMALVTGSAYLHLRETREAGLPLSAFALAAAALTRPEGLIAAAATGAAKAAGLLDGSQRRERLLWFAAWAVAFLAVYLPYFLWRFAYYDHLFPNTYYAKVGTTQAIFDRGLNYVWFYGLRYHLLALAVGVALLLPRPRLRNDAAYLLVLSAAMLAGVVYEGGDAFGHGRFVVPLLPLLYLAGLAGFATLLDRLELPLTRGTLLVSTVLVLGALSLFPGLREQIICRQTDDIAPRRALGEWFTANAPDDFTIAAYAVGALGYYTEQDVLDLLGINDVTIAHTNVPDFGSGIAGHEKYNHDYVLDIARPEVIVPADNEPGPVTTEEFRARFASPARPAGRTALFVDPRLWDQYEVRSIYTDGYWFNVLVRKDAIGRLPGLR
jgi:hypothetical protein